ncbi:MAG: N-acetylglucosamine-6-phosphate deacetylase, partial [Chloroflexia bacterium]
MRVVLRGARVVDADGERADESLTLSDSKIESVGTTLPDGTAANLDLTGLTITPGFIDVHTHGGGGYDLHTTDPEEIGRYARWAPSGGTTAFLIGVVGVPDGMPETQLSTAASATSA